MPVPEDMLNISNPDGCFFNTDKIASTASSTCRKSLV